MTFIPGFRAANITGNTANAGTAISSGTMVLAGGNNVTLSQAGSTITISGANAVAQTNQTLGLYATTNTTGQSSSTTVDARSLTFQGMGNVSVGFSGGSVQLSGSQSAQTLSMVATGNTTQVSTQTRDARSLIFAGSGAASIGLSSGTILVSVPTQSVQTQNMVSVNGSTGAISFANGNNVTLGGNASTITASASFNQTNQTLAMTALGTNTTQNTTATVDARSLSFSGGGLVSIGFSNGTIQLSGSQTNQTASNIQAIAAAGGTPSTGTVSFSNLNGLSFGIAGQTLTASHNGITSQTNQTISGYAVGNTAGQSSNTNFDARTLSFSGAGIASVGYSAGAVLVSVPSGAPSPVNFSAGTTSNNLGSVVFSNSNNVSFGLNGSTITASAAGGGGGGIAAVADTIASTFTDGTVNFADAGGALTISASNGGGGSQTINFSVPATSSLVATGLLSISTNVSTISLGVADQTVSTYVNMLPASTGSQTLGSLGVTNGTPHFFPVSIDTPVKFNALRLAMNFSFVTSAVSGQQTLSHTYGIYSRNGNTLSLISSSGMTYNVTNSSVSATLSAATATGTAGYSYGTMSASATLQIQQNFGNLGLRPIDLQFGNTMSLDRGMYWLGMIKRESSSSATIGLSVGLAGNVVTSMNALAPLGSNSASLTTNFALRGPYAGHGTYLTTNTALAASVALSGINQAGTLLPFMTFIST